MLIKCVVELESVCVSGRGGGHVTREQAKMQAISPEPRFESCRRHEN